MIRCKVEEGFTLEKFDELRNIKRKNLDTYGRLYVGDEFECDEKMAKYLTGENDKKKVVVKILEIQEDKQEKKFIPLKLKEDVDTEKVIEEMLEKAKETVEKKSKKKKIEK